MLLSVENKVEGTALYIRMTGVLDFSTVDRFDFINETPDFITEFNVDFSKLDFIDSTGIGALINILHKANELGAMVNFNGMSDETKDLFETIGVFDIKKTLLGEEL